MIILLLCINLFIVWRILVAFRLMELKITQVYIDTNSLLEAHLKVGHVKQLNITREQWDSACDPKLNPETDHIPVAPVLNLMTLEPVPSRSRARHEA